MPVMTGPECIAVLRQKEYKGRIIGLTGSTMQSDVQAFMDNGADGVVPKPVKPSELHCLFIAPSHDD